MTTAKQWRIDEMPLQPTEHRVWQFEISLIVVVQACQGSNVLHGTDGGLINGHADNDCSKGNEDVI